MSRFSLTDLEAIVAERAGADPSLSWTARLVAGGMGKASKKLGEEAVETVIAAMTGDRRAIVSESADLLFHLLVVLRMSDIALSDVMGELEQRTMQSGIAEKAARWAD